MLLSGQHIRHASSTPCGSICAGLKPNSLQARRKAAALALESGGLCHWRLERVSSAKAFAPAEKTCVTHSKEGSNHVPVRMARESALKYHGKQFPRCNSP